MKINQISAEISEETEDQVVQSLMNCEQLMGCLVNLTKDERHRMVKMSRSYTDFVQRSMMYAMDHPQHLPYYADLEEFKKDVNLAARLTRIMAVIESLGNQVRDTLMLVGSDSYANARLFYKGVKEATNQGAPGAGPIYKDLAYLYKRIKVRDDSNLESNKKKNAIARDVAWYRNKGSKAVEMQSEWVDPVSGLDSRHWIGQIKRVEAASRRFSEHWNQ